MRTHANLLLSRDPINAESIQEGANHNLHLKNSFLEDNLRGDQHLCKTILLLAISDGSEVLQNHSPLKVECPVSRHRLEENLSQEMQHHQGFTDRRGAQNALHKEHQTHRENREEHLPLRIASQGRLEEEEENARQVSHLHHAPGDDE
mmetsp:Transcript_9776/g.36461  ORF Transcript_9776/g.36461 Transcript_9776/m.36461 type:complete len:148 (-) Transcript_9776:2111-2554(-)